jgi:hypothetical protein
LNPKIKRYEIGAVFVAMILMAGVLTFSFSFSSSSHLQSADAKKDSNDKYDKLRESLRKKAEATAGISDRGDGDIFGSNTNTGSAIGIDGTDGVKGVNGANGTSVTGADGSSGIEGTDGVSISGMGASGINGTDGADGISVTGMGASGVNGTDGGDGISKAGSDGLNGTEGAGAGVNDVIEIGADG